MSGRVGVIMAVALLALASALQAHPQDGPHADVRIAINDDAVVIRVSMNLVFLDEMVDIIREDADVIAEIETESVRSALLAHLLEAHPLTVNGVVANPRAGPLALNNPDRALLGLFPISGMRGLRKVELTLTYELDTPPQTVAFVWGTYPADVLTDLDPAPPLVIAAELVEHGRRRIIEFRAEEPEYIWHAPPATGRETPSIPVPRNARDRYRLPGAALVIIGAGVLVVLVTGRRIGSAGRALVLLGTLAGGVALRSDWPVEIDRRSGDLPSAAAAEEVFVFLHGAIYRAFDFVSEDAIYDALDECVDGGLRDQLYRDIYQALIMREEGGAVSQVTAINRLETTVESIGVIDASGRRDVGFVVHCRFHLDGAVYHWGHSHERTSEYDARYTVIATPKGWRIGGVEVLEHFHLEPELFDGSFEL